MGRITTFVLAAWRWAANISTAQWIAQALGFSLMGWLGWLGGQPLWFVALLALAGAALACVIWTALAGHARAKVTAQPPQDQLHIQHHLTSERAEALRELHTLLEGVPVLHSTQEIYARTSRLKRLIRVIDGTEGEGQRLYNSFDFHDNWLQIARCTEEDTPENTEWKYRRMNQHGNFRGAYMMLMDAWLRGSDATRAKEYLRQITSYTSIHDFDDGGTQFTPIATDPHLRLKRTSMEAANEQQS